MIDPPLPLFKMEMFYEIMEFARSGLPLAVHCNEGLSRAPVVALFAAIATGILPPMHWDEAQTYLKKKDPYVQTGKGLNTFMKEAWWPLMEYTEKNAGFKSKT